MHDKTLWQHDDPDTYRKFLESEFSYFATMSCEKSRWSFFTAEILANRWNSMNANDFTSSSFLSHDFRISDHYDIAATPAILICILCFTGNLLYPLSWFQAKGSYCRGFATKSVFHEASRVSLMVMLMEICWRVEISHNRYNMTFCHEMLFATVPDGKYYSIWYCNIPQCIHFLR